MSDLNAPPVLVRPMAPAGWYTKQSWTLLSPDGASNVIVSCEPLAPDQDTATYAAVQGELLQREFPGYAQLGMTEIMTPQGPIPLRMFEWSPPDGVRVRRRPGLLGAAGGVRPHLRPSGPRRGLHRDRTCVAARAPEFEDVWFEVLTATLLGHLRGPSRAEREPAGSWTSNEVGCCSRRADRQALEAARAALVDDPHDDDALLLLARATLRLGDFHEALRAAEAVSGGASPADVHVVRALSLDGLGRRRQALAAALEATRAAPEWAGAHIVVAEVARSSRRHRRTAWDAAAHACRLAPDDANAHATMGSVALTRRRSDVAERAFREALRLDPSHAGARHGLGVVQTERGAFGPAADSFWRSCGPIRRRRGPGPTCTRWCCGGCSAPTPAPGSRP